MTETEVRNWIKFPNFFKHKIKKAAKNGTLLLLINSASDPELVASLRQLFAEVLKELDSDSLLKLYRKLDKKATVASKSYSNKVEEQFIRVNPMRRDCARFL